MTRKPASKPTPRWATLNHAAEYFDCSRDTIRRYISAGLLPSARKVGKSVKVDLNELDEIGKPIASARRSA
jgi:excisionase family DNA binding protein